MEKISEVSFVDLYIGDDFTDFNGFAGSEGRTVAPASMEADITALRKECQKVYEKLQEPEFPLMYDGIMFRVTMIPDAMGKFIYILRRSSASIRALGTLGLAQPILQKLLDKNARGLILIAGEMASGKTSTAATLVAEWLKRNGGYGITLEDPPETPLNNVWGAGRCFTALVTENTGGYKAAMRRALRANTKIMLLGEIRDSETALEVLQAGNNGHLILSTLHAGSPSQAIERMASFCAAEPNVNMLLSEALFMVIWQKLSVTSGPPASDGKQTKFTRIKASCLEVRDQVGVKTKIKEGLLSSLTDDIEQQANRIAWTMQEQRKRPGTP